MIGSIYNTILNINKGTTSDRSVIHPSSRLKHTNWGLPSQLNMKGASLRVPDMMNSGVRIPDMSIIKQPNRSPIMGSFLSRPKTAPSCPVVILDKLQYTDPCIIADKIYSRYKIQRLRDKLNKPHRDYPDSIIFPQLEFKEYPREELLQASPRLRFDPLNIRSQPRPKINKATRWRDLIQSPHMRPLMATIIYYSSAWIIGLEINPGMIDGVVDDCNQAGLVQPEATPSVENPAPYSQEEIDKINLGFVIPAILLISMITYKVMVGN